MRYLGLLHNILYLLKLSILKTKCEDMQLFLPPSGPPEKPPKPLPVTQVNHKQYNRLLGNVLRLCEFLIIKKLEKCKFGSTADFFMTRIELFVKCGH